MECKYTIYFLDEFHKKICYVDHNLSPHHCSFEFFEEYAIILTPLMEELL